MYIRVYQCNSGEAARTESTEDVAIYQDYIGMGDVGPRYKYRYNLFILYFHKTKANIDNATQPSTRSKKKERGENWLT